MQILKFFTDLQLFDFLLIGVVALMVCCVAYLRQPRLKAFILFLPLPSTVVILSIGKPVDVSFLLGLPLLVLFFISIYVLYNKLSVNILISIAISASLYCLAGGCVLPFLSDSPGVFYSTFLAILVLAIFLYRWASNTHEKGYQAPLPIYVKAPIVILIVFMLVKMKYFLSGFMAGFPMVGVVGAYETRYCFKTVFRQLPFVIFSLSSMIAVCFTAQRYFGLYGGLAAGWVVYFAMLIFLRKMWLGSTDDSASAACK